MMEAGSFQCYPVTGKEAMDRLKTRKLHLNIKTKFFFCALEQVAQEAVKSLLSSEAFKTWLDTVLSNLL